VSGRLRINGFKVILLSLLVMGHDMVINNRVAFGFSLFLYKVFEVGNT